MGLLWLILGLALARPPSGVDADDVDKWERGEDRLLDGPSGCWVFEGTVSVRLAMYQAPDALSAPRQVEEVFEGTFQGRMVDGDWKRFDYKLADSRGELGLQVPIFPLTGRIDQRVVNQDRREELGHGAVVEVGKAEEDVTEGRGSFTFSFDGRSASFSIDDVSPMNLLRKAVDDWGSDVSTAFSEWDDDKRGVVLYRDVPINNKARAPVVVVTTFFPNGRPLPTRMDAVWPRVVRLGKFPARVTLRNAQLHLRGTYAYDAVLPTVETAAAVVNALGYNLSYEQKLAYTRASSCAGRQAPTPETPADNTEAALREALEQAIERSQLPIEVGR